MNHIKIQQEILKAAEKRDATDNDKCFDYLYFVKGEDIYVVYKQYAVYVIPLKDFYLNIDAVFKKPPVQLENLLKEEDIAKDCVDLRTEKKVPVGNNAVRVFQIVDDEDEEMWVDLKYLKVFNLEWCTFKASKTNAPLLIYEDDKLTGLILPVAHPKKNKEGMENE